MSETNPFRLDGEVTLITGRRRSVLQEAVEALGERASYIVADVTRPDAAAELVAEVVNRHGTLTVLVNNAGVHLKKPIEDTGNDEFANVMRTHVDGGALVAL